MLNIKDMIYLESVGSFYDPKNGMIYPKRSKNNEPDLDCGISLEEDEAYLIGGNS